MAEVSLELQESLLRAARQHGMSLPSAVRQGVLAGIAHELPLELLTWRARDTIRQAAAYARDFDHDYVGTEHLLLAMIADEAGVGGGLLKHLGVVDLIRSRLHSLMASAEYRSPSRRVYKGGDDE